MTQRIRELYSKLRELIWRSFPDIVASIDEPYGKLRVYLVDGSYLDIWFSHKISGRYAYHWEHRHINGGIHRYDNRPHEFLKYMKTFPKHFHDEAENNVRESQISEQPEDAIMYFLNFIRKKILERKTRKLKTNLK